MTNPLLRALVLPGVLGLALIGSAPARAAVLFSDLTAWQAGVSASRATPVIAAGAEGSVPSSIVLSGGSTLGSFSTPVEKRVVGSTWSSWPNQPASNGTTVYFADGATDLLFSFEPGFAIGGGAPRLADAFGFFVEPASFDAFDITLQLGTGQSIRRSVSGDAGAAFFGWTGLGATTIRLTTAAGAEGFALGQFYEGTSIPEPSSCLLLAVGLAGIGMTSFRRRS